MEQSKFLKLFSKQLEVLPVGTGHFRDPNIESYRLGTERPDLYSDLPYHNQEHCEDVASIAVHLLQLELMRKDNTLPSKTYLASTLLAGLFHDAGHSGGLLSDRENIALTEVKLRQVFPEQIFPNQFPDLEYIHHAITFTQYPHVKSPDSCISKCLMDADMITATLCRDSNHVLLNGLLVEINSANATKEIPLLEPEEFYKKQVELYDYLITNLHTPSAKLLLSKYGFEALLELKKAVQKDK